MGQNPSAVGQVSAEGQFRWDGQQWVPIAPGTREPTSWTRPMQVANASIFAVSAVFSLAAAFIFLSHDTMVRALKAQGTQPPPGMSYDTLAETTIAFTAGVIVFVSVLQLIAAVGSFLGWRWVFWAALVLFGFGAIGAIANITRLVNPDTSPIPIGAVAASELLSLANLAMFIWMLIGVIRFGPWATKRPGT